MADQRRKPNEIQHLRNWSPNMALQAIQPQTNSSIENFSAQPQIRQENYQNSTSPMRPQTVAPTTETANSHTNMRQISQPLPMANIMRPQTSNPRMSAQHMQAIYMQAHNMLGVNGNHISNVHGLPTQQGSNNLAQPSMPQNMNMPQLTREEFDKQMAFTAMQNRYGQQDQLLQHETNMPPQTQAQARQMVLNEMSPTTMQGPTSLPHTQAQIQSRNYTGHLKTMGYGLNQHNNGGARIAQPHENRSGMDWQQKWPQMTSTATQKQSSPPQHTINNRKGYGQAQVGQSPGNYRQTSMESIKDNASRKADFRLDLDQPPESHASSHSQTWMTERSHDNMSAFGRELYNPTHPGLYSATNQQRKPGSIITTPMPMNNGATSMYGGANSLQPSKYGNNVNANWSPPNELDFSSMLNDQQTDINELYNQSYYGSINTGPLTHNVLNQNFAQDFNRSVLAATSQSDSSNSRLSRMSHGHSTVPTQPQWRTDTLWKPGLPSIGMDGLSKTRPVEQQTQILNPGFPELSAKEMEGLVGIVDEDEMRRSEQIETFNGIVGRKRSSEDMDAASLSTPQPTRTSQRFSSLANVDWSSAFHYPGEIESQNTRQLSASKPRQETDMKSNLNKTKSPGSRSKSFSKAHAQLRKKSDLGMLAKPSSKLRLIEKSKTNGKKKRLVTPVPEVARSERAKKSGGFYDNDVANQVLKELGDDRPTTQTSPGSNAGQINKGNKETPDSNVSTSSTAVKRTKLQRADTGSVTAAGHGALPSVNSDSTLIVEQQIAENGSTRSFDCRQLPGMNPSKPDYNPHLMHESELMTPKGRRAVLERSLAASFSNNPTCMPSAGHVPSRLNTLAEPPKRASSSMTARYPQNQSAKQNNADSTQETMLKSPASNFISHRDFRITPTKAADAIEQITPPLTDSSINGRLRIPAVSPLLNAGHAPQTEGNLHLEKPDEETSAASPANSFPASNTTSELGKSSIDSTNTTNGNVTWETNDNMAPVDELFDQYWGLLDPDPELDFFAT